MRLAVLGAGSWGTALAIALAERFDTVALWARDSARAAEMQRTRANARYLPGFLLPEHLSVVSDFGPALAGADVVLSAVPSTHLRGVLAAAARFIPEDSIIVSATKGIEQGTFFRMSQLISDVLGRQPVAVSPGPTFAKEIAAGEPAAVVTACQEFAIAENVQRLFATPTAAFLCQRGCDRGRAWGCAQECHRDRRGRMPRSGPRQQ